MNVTIELSKATERILSQFPALTKRALESAKNKAGSSAMRRMRTAVTRIVRDQKAVSLTYARKQVRAFKSDRGRSPSWTVRVDGSPIPIGKFRMRQLRRGVKFQANRGTWSLYQGGFIATMKSGHKGAFARKSGVGRRKRYTNTQGQRQTKQLPIKELYTSGLSASFKHEALQHKVRDIGVAEYERTLRRVLRSKM